MPILLYLSMAPGLVTLQDYLVNQTTEVSLTNLAVSLLIAAGLSYILARLYITYGTGLSNRKKFSSNFMLLTTTTTLIITIIKSSLALSLGLVGALSIVRFRAAIKEPEELAFLFLAIAIGLGLGANQIGVTLLSFVIISGVIYGKHFFDKKGENQNLYLNIVGKNSKELSLSRIANILKKYCSSVHLKRFDHTDKGEIDTSFLVGFKSLVDLEKLKEELESISKSVSITYIDQTGLY